MYVIFFNRLTSTKKEIFRHPRHQQPVPVHLPCLPPTRKLLIFSVKEKNPIVIKQLTLYTRREQFKFKRFLILEDLITMTF